MTTTDTTTTCSHCGREIGVTCGTDVATYVNGLPYCGEDAPESESTLWLGTSDDCGGEGMADEEWDRYVALVQDAVGHDVEVIECRRPGGGLEALVVDADGREDRAEAERLVELAQDIWDAGEWAA